MKKYMIIILLFLYGCSSEDSTPSGTVNNTGASVSVNHLGEWDYRIFTQNSICDGVIAQGTYFVESLPADSSKIGNIRLTGTGYDNDQFGNCFTVDIDEVETGWRGRPATMTADEYLGYVREDNVGDNTVQSVRLDAYTDRKVVEVITYTNTVVITTTATR
jgi:hypothetical protein